jgi:hypothetical protein
MERKDMGMKTISDIGHLISERGEWLVRKVSGAEDREWKEKLQREGRK